MYENGALSGITVLDLSRVLAGPYCGMMLADMGANVIKIEQPKVGDDSRGMYPTKNGESYYYMNLNRNKRGMTLNLKAPEGKEVFKKLVAKADILLENYRPGVMKRLGLDYEVLKEINPKLVYGCISGFGQYGPYSNRGGYDLIAQAMGGLMSTTGWPDSGPTRSGTAIGDVTAGMSAAIGVLAAYINAQKTGVGQMVDVALVDSIVSSQEIINQIYLATGELPQRTGNRYASGFPYDSFHAKDGDLVFAAGNDKMFSKFADFIGMPELKTDPLYCSNVLRVKNWRPLKDIIEKWLSQYTVDEAVDLLLSAGFPAGPILSLDQIVADPHIAGAREMFVEMEHPAVGKMKVTGNQIKLSGTPVEITQPAPLLGQHTKEILHDMIGMDADGVDKLTEKGIF